MTMISLKPRTQTGASIALILGAITFLSGCEKEVPRTDYFPLRDGNRWEYRLLDRPLLKRMAAGQPIVTAEIDADIKAPEEADPSTDIAKAEVADIGKVPDFVGPNSEKKGAGDEPVVKNAKPAVARRVALELRAAVDELTFRALYDTAEQVWSKRSGYVGFQAMKGRSYLLILPPHTGYRWIVTGAAGQDLFYEIETASGTVSTPKGPFHDCAVARQESRDRKEIYRYWFAPNIGLVRRSKYFMNEEVFRQELVEYTVRPATPQTRMAEDQEVSRAMKGANRGTEFRQRTKREITSEDIDKAPDDPDSGGKKYDSKLQKE